MAKHALRLPDATLLPAGVMATAGGAQSLRTVAELEGDIEAELDASLVPTAERRRLPVLTKRAAKAADAEPEHVARLMRSWMNEEDSQK